MCPQSVLNKKTPLKTLKKRSEFLRSYKGEKIRRDFFVLYVVKNNLGINRVGITVPKTSGTAVVRNKWKRWIKEEFKKTKSKERSLDLHFFVKTKKTKEEFKKAEYQRVKKEIGEVLESVFKGS